MNAEYLNTIWIISMITIASVVLLPLFAWIIGYMTPQEKET
jgi:hypothetical protein